MAKVYVGLSGGVDSAVSAALLKEQGHKVTGAFIKIWQPEFLECTWREDRLDAMRVAASLNIPFKELDLSEEYQREVIDSMLTTYKRGETPNPDVLCNKGIKFGSFAKWAFEDGADFIATGHYARTSDGRLYRGLDTAKDQSYFLHQVDGSILKRSLFPVGSMTKPEVRAAAVRFKLPVAVKHDSQGLCFVGDITMSEFLRRYIEVKEGDVLDLRGRVIGRHEGAMLYTIGQRHGFMLHTAAVPHFVTSIDVNTNTLVVSDKKDDAMTRTVNLTDIHWINRSSSSEPLSAQVRYRERSVPITLTNTEQRSAVFESPQIASPGQSLVFYHEDECLGGGVIAPFVHNERG
jgi:tRNA-specific 2-thiouridylase